MVVLFRFHASSGHGFYVAAGCGHLFAARKACGGPGPGGEGSLLCTLGTHQVQLFGPCRVLEAGRLGILEALFSFASYCIFHQKKN
jgi:hypothetical protein